MKCAHLNIYTPNKTEKKTVEKSLINKMCHIIRPFTYKIIKCSLTIYMETTLNYNLKFSLPNVTQVYLISFLQSLHCTHI